MGPIPDTQACGTVGGLTSSALLLSRTYFPSRSTSSTVTRPLADACWLMRVRAMAPPATLDASLSVSLGRRRLAGELVALCWAAREWTAAPEE